MPWDPAILRKFNTTGHFRLLSQLRTEIKAHPLPRQKGALQDEGSGGAGTGPIEVRPQPMGYSRSRRGGSHGGGQESSSGFSPSLDSSTEGSSLSFRDRLNAIEMR